MSFISCVTDALNAFTRGENLQTTISVITLAIVLGQLCVFMVDLLKKEEINRSPFNFIINAATAFNVALSVLEYKNSSMSFKSVDEIVLFNGSVIAVNCLFSFALRLTDLVKANVKKTNVKPVENGEKIVESEGVGDMSANKPTEIKNVIRLKCVPPDVDGGKYDGYLDVSYLKSLITVLKTKNLTEDDKQELEDFEVYLMNFAARQPYNGERTKLSGYLSDFMKKLARYDAV